MGDAQQKSVVVKIYNSAKEPLDEEKWAYSKTIYRLFSYSIKNQSGPLPKLIGKALSDFYRPTEILLYGYADFPSSKTKTIEIEFIRYRLTWFPPREFIVTYPPRYYGQIFINFEIKTFIHNGDRENIVWQDYFKRQETVVAYPGDEIQTLSSITNQLLSDWLIQIRPGLLY